MKKTLKALCCVCVLGICRVYANDVYGEIDITAPVGALTVSPGDTIAVTFTVDQEFSDLSTSIVFHISSDEKLTWPVQVCPLVSHAGCGLQKTDAVALRSYAALFPVDELSAEVSSPFYIRIQDYAGEPFTAKAYAGPVSIEEKKSEDDDGSCGSGAGLALMVPVFFWGFNEKKRFIKK